MTKDEFLTAMLELYDQYNDDPEAFHSSADDLMCDLLVGLGYEDGIKVFDSADKWYA